RWRCRLWLVRERHRHRPLRPPVRPCSPSSATASTSAASRCTRSISMPPAHLWVTTFPTSDKGEPHTQEHLLLGKGNRGRRLGSNEAMALVTSNAFTEQWRTSYTFKTVAGPEAYWGELADHLDAMLNPDETDEEIRREVRNFGIDKGDDGKLRLGEKGTVYNEMVGYYENPEAVARRAIGQMV